MKNLKPWHFILLFLVVYIVGFFIQTKSDKSINCYYSKLVYEIKSSEIKEHISSDTISKCLKASFPLGDVSAIQLKNDTDSVEVSYQTRLSQPDVLVALIANIKGDTLMLSNTIDELKLIKRKSRVIISFTESNGYKRKGRLTLFD